MLNFIIQYIVALWRKRGQSRLYLYLIYTQRCPTLAKSIPNPLLLIAEYRITFWLSFLTIDFLPVSCDTRHRHNHNYVTRYIVHYSEFYFPRFDGFPLAKQRRAYSLRICFGITSRTTYHSVSVSSSILYRRYAWHSMFAIRQCGQFYTDNLR